MKRSVHKKNLVNKYLLLVAVGISFALAGFAQTYNTQAAGNWNSPGTWVGGQVPSANISSGRVVNIKHKVTFNLNSDLDISGTLNVTDTLVFPSSYSRNVDVKNGRLTVINGGFIQSLNNRSDMSSDGGTIIFTNSYVFISKGFLAEKKSRRTIKNSKLWVGDRYQLNGGGGPNVSIDTIQSSLVQTSNDFEIMSGNTLRAANAIIKVLGTNNFKNSGTINVLPGAYSNYAFDFLKVANDLTNNGAWTARIDGACIGGQINGSQMAAIDFTRAQDCGGVAVGNAPELVFKNPVLVSGQGNRQGAIYRFNNVVSGVDATIRLKKFSRNDIVMQNIDLASMGWDKAFQPQFGMPGYVQPNQNWYIDFELKFLQAGTNNSITLPKVDMTALDVDGDGVSVREYAVFQNPSNVIYSTVSYLAEQPAGVVGQTFTCPIDSLVSVLIPCVVCGGDGKTGPWNLTDCTVCNATGIVYSLCGHGYQETTGNQLQGPVENFMNIDTAATQVMATYQYTDVNTINFRYGARSGTSPSNGAGIRLNSLWFRQFNLAPPTVLPIKLSDFAAFLNRKDVNLSWVGHEENFSHYVLQRSTDGKEFSDIAVIFAANASSATRYQYKDANVASATGAVFYRLQLVDKVKEAAQYSEVRVIRLGKEVGPLQLVTYPNPVVSQVRVTLPAEWQGKPVMLELYTVNGTRVQSVQLGSASQTETMDVTKASNGFYLVKATCNGQTAQQRIVKN